MPGKTKPTQDPSGHVTFTAQQMAFYSMAQRRAERTEAARNAGVLEYKASRNPMRAEKTPRGSEYKCFDFGIPDGPKDLKEWERWKYPEWDLGLMGKFRSQKSVYEEYMRKHFEYTRKLEEYREQEAQKKEHAAALTQRSARSVEAPEGLWGQDPNEQQQSSRAGAGAGAGTARHSARDLYDFDDYLGEGGSARGGGRNKKTGRKVPPLPLSDAGSNNNSSSNKISEFRMIAGLNPEALAKWRAKRAADFVTTQKHPLDPPTGRELVEKPFVVTICRDGQPEPKAPNEVRKIRPPPSKFALAAGGGGVGVLQESLSQLMGELQRTDAEIERNKLALKLKAGGSGRYG